ncbi:MAG: metalloregulator ArsR/SmtB family transcription factor [Candidatus Dormibacteraeota bacterium]|nr:metalloregulator ArsR/SmtB family transcription factor [Candidatus Dormibacteraeota bacterium]
MEAAARIDPLDALGNPQRRAIVEILGEQPRSVGEIADALPISRPAVSRHLRLLSEAGLVAGEQLGARRLYRLEGAGVDIVRRYLEAVWGDAASRFRVFADSTRPGQSD